MPLVLLFVLLVLFARRYSGQMFQRLPALRFDPRGDEHDEHERPVVFIRRGEEVEHVTRHPINQLWHKGWIGLIDATTTITSSIRGFPGKEGSVTPEKTIDIKQ